MPYIIIGVIIFVILVIICNIKIVPQAQVYVVERLGTFYSEWTTGPHFLMPFLDRIAKKVSIKDQIVDFKPQSVITKDNVSMQIDTVVFFQVTDAKQYAYGVELYGSIATERYASYRAEFFGLNRGYAFAQPLNFSCLRGLWQLKIRRR